MSKHGRVLVAMSGGIDSTVAAMLLHEQGYEVVGITMKTWDYANSGGAKKETGCCSLDSINDARTVAVKMGFHHFILDIRNEFGDSVIDNFVEEYLAGRTPNPCVLCNTHIKWEALLKRADALDCPFIATGHYARVGELEGRKYISRAKDTSKDQSYVLWGLSQACLERTLFPLSELVKPEVRTLAAERGYEELAKKAESYEICFVPDNDYRGFLKRKRPELESALKGGLYVDQDGKVLGTHEGYPFYTIGQRKGLGVHLGQPMFVTDIQPDQNIVVLGHEDDLQRSGMRVYKTNWQKKEEPQSMECIVKIRYRDPGTWGILDSGPNHSANVLFHVPAKSITPGQSAVFYEGDDVVGGGIIQSGYTFDPSE
ncbi:MAG TPA: tRNA 2-thiouridine(34) synthase MnmA [Saprospiraceae bacterium]|nr:tRNA 2-thiouridine(34) synthase MnmA [Saprospiraceae bacterium]